MLLSTTILNFITVLNRSNPNGLIFWCVVGLGAGIYLFFRGFRLLQRRQLILNTPVSKIRSASLGMVEISGLAVGPYTMLAPITGRACYYYRTVVWEWKQSGKQKQWVKVAVECMHVPFFLDDNTGKVMVDPRGADLDLHLDFEQEYCDSFFTTKQEASDNVRAFLSRHNVTTSNKIKVDEFCIKPKNALFLLGTLAENSGVEVRPEPIEDREFLSIFSAQPFSFSFGDKSLSSVGSVTGSVLSDAAPLGEEMVGEHSLRELGYDKSNLYKAGYSRSAQSKGSQVINLSPASAPASAAEMTQQQKIAAAMMKAGISSPAAWATAGITPSTVLVTQEQKDSSQATGLENSTVDASPLVSSTSGSSTLGSSTSGFDLHPPVVLMKGKNNPTFLISWRSQRDLANSLGWKCTLMIWGGPLLALLCLYGLRTLTRWF